MSPRARILLIALTLAATPTWLEAQQPPFQQPGQLPPAFQQQTPTQNRPQPQQRGLMRFHIPIWDQMSYIHPHPLSELRGEPGESLADAPGALGGLFYIRRRAFDPDENILETIFYWVPSFALEYGFSTGLVFPAAYSLGTDFLHVSSTVHGDHVQSISFDSYYFTGVGRLYFFEYGAPGINYFLGVGTGFVYGIMEGLPHVDSPRRKLIHFRQGPLGMTRLGLEYVFGSGNWSFRYEVGNVNAKRASFNENPYREGTTTEIDLSGTYTRVSFTYKP